MLIASHTVTTRHRAAFGGCMGVAGAKRIAGIGTRCMCMRTCIGRIQGCRPGTATRPGSEQRD